MGSTSVRRAGKQLFRFEISHGECERFLHEIIVFRLHTYQLCTSQPWEHTMEVLHEVERYERISFAQSRVQCTKRGDET